MADYGTDGGVYRLLREEGVQVLCGFVAFFVAAATVTMALVYWNNARWTEESRHQNEAIAAVVAAGGTHAEQWEKIALIKGHSPHQCKYAR